MKTVLPHITVQTLSRRDRAKDFDMNNKWLHFADSHKLLENHGRFEYQSAMVAANLHDTVNTPKPSSPFHGMWGRSAKRVTTLNFDLVALTKI
jgi:hypothetical protein